jgi:hypothetical protein
LPSIAKYGTGTAVLSVHYVTKYRANCHVISEFFRQSQQLAL